MIYRDFGNTGLKVSAIGMGCEYVWTADEQKVKEVVGAAVEAGVNYFDLFVGTPSTREYFGKALAGVRDKVYLAGHLGCADKDGQYMKTRHEALRKDFLNQFYEKLNTDYIDVLFLHNCDDMEDLDGILNGWMYAYAKGLKGAGKAGFIGISSHSTKIALEAVRSGKIEALMFPVNPLFNLLPQDSADARMKGRAVAELTDEEKSAYPTKQELYAEYEKRGLPIVAMKPFAAGNILKGSSGPISGLLELTPCAVHPICALLPGGGLPGAGLCQRGGIEPVPGMAQRHSGGKGSVRHQRQPSGQIPRPVYVPQPLPALPQRHRNRPGDKAGRPGRKGPDGRAARSIRGVRHSGRRLHPVRLLHQALPLWH